METGGAGHGEIYVADFDGRNAVPLTQDHAIVAAPAWASSDKLLYCSYKLGAPAIYSQLLSSGARASVARYPGGNFSPAVSQDGHRVAMILSKNGSPDLYVANVDGSGLKQLTFTKEAESSPCWSPDNQTICYCSRQNGGVASLFKISASGGSPSRLQTTGAPSPTEPDWSPDGRWIAFTSLAGSFQICIVAASGGEAIVLVPGEDPSWAPNSRAIIFCAGSDHAKHLSLLDVPTRRVNSLGRILESNSQPSWAR